MAASINPDNVNNVTDFGSDHGGDGGSGGSGGGLEGQVRLLQDQVKELRLHYEVRISGLEKKVLELKTQLLEEEVRRLKSAAAAGGGGGDGGASGAAGAGAGAAAAAAAAASSSSTTKSNVVDNTKLGKGAHGKGWASLSHADAYTNGKNYSFLAHKDASYALVNKKSGGGHIGWRIDNIDHMWMKDDGVLQLKSQVIDNTKLGKGAHGKGWASLSHADAYTNGKNYSFLAHRDASYALVNKKSGGGHIGFRVDNSRSQAKREL